MKLLFLAAVFLVIGSAASKLLPTIPINENLEKIVPSKFLEPLKNLNKLFEDFNSKVDMEKLQPALLKGGAAGLSVVNSIQKLVTIFATGQYINPLAIGGMAQQGLTTTQKVLEAMEAVREIPVQIPADQPISFALTQMSKVLNVLKCLNPLNCISFGR